MRHYTLKRTVVQAEDMEKAEPGQINAEGRPEAPASELTDVSRDDDTRTASVDVNEAAQSLEGHQVEL